jgi:Tfp pilus assembly protein PilV
MKRVIKMQYPPQPGDYRRRKHRNPRGMVLILFLVCLAVAAAMVAGAARIALSSHQATQTAAWSVQARLLAESGVERAAAKLAADAAYSGETWTIPAAELGGQDGGVVRIEVKLVAGEEKRRAIKIEADFPEDPVHFARQQKEINVTIP